MANMSYCRFVNTYQDLRDCCENMEEKLSEEEKKYKIKLINLCRKIVDNYCDDDDDEEE
jgi:hypothetical protein